MIAVSHSLLAGTRGEKTVDRFRGRRLVNSLGRRVLPGGEAGQDGVMNALVDHRGAEADYLTALA